MKKLRQRLSAQVEIWMIRERLDVQQLARRSTLSEKTIYRILTGDVGASVDSLEKLGLAFSIDPFLLLIPIEAAEPKGEEGRS